MTLPRKKKIPKSEFISGLLVTDHADFLTQWVVYFDIYVKVFKGSYKLSLLCDHNAQIGDMTCQQFCSSFDLCSCSSFDGDGHRKWPKKMQLQPQNRNHCP